MVIMERGSLTLLLDLAVDFLAIAGVLYLFSRGYFAELEPESLDAVFLALGLLGLALITLTIYLLVKRE